MNSSVVFVASRYDVSIHALTLFPFLSPTYPSQLVVHLNCKQILSTPITRQFALEELPNYPNHLRLSTPKRHNNVSQATATPQSHPTSLVPQPVPFPPLSPIVPKGNPHLRHSDQSQNHGLEVFSAASLTMHIYVQSAGGSLVLRDWISLFDQTGLLDGLVRRLLDRAALMLVLSLVLSSFPFRPYSQLK